jgi:predicted SAM-dependent methyltransferase
VLGVRRLAAIVTGIMSIKKNVGLFAIGVAKKLSSRRDIANYLQRNRSPKINIGSQTNYIDGWLNVDIFPFPGHVYMDVSKPWPIPDTVMTAALCEHMIEHVPKDAGRNVLTEAFRTMAPGAKLRVVTPNQVAFAKMTLDSKCREATVYMNFVRQRHPDASVSDAVNMIYHEYGHRHIYTPDELAEMLISVGFSEVVEAKPGVSNDPLFQGVEGHPKLLGFEENAVEAFALDAVKA